MKFDASPEELLKFADWVYKTYKPEENYDLFWTQLSEINLGVIKNQEELNEACKTASFIGTLQAGYTDFFYLREEWKINMVMVYQVF